MEFLSQNLKNFEKNFNYRDEISIPIFPAKVFCLKFVVMPIFWMEFFPSQILVEMEF